MSGFTIKIPPGDEDKFLRVPYDQRWEYLKPVIASLYLGTSTNFDEPMKMGALVRFMRETYSFSAQPRSYKYYLRKWGINKNIKAVDSESIVQAIGKRRNENISTSNVSILQGGSSKPVNAKKLKRFINDQARHGAPILQMAPGVLSIWNLPYVALAQCLPRADHRPSPFGHAPATPTYLTINSPTTEGIVPSSDNPSPSTQVVLQKCLNDRSSLLLQGRFEELLISCGKEDRIILTNYMHDFYIHSYVTAKYWGKGPQAWAPQMISALTSSGVDTPESSGSARQSVSESSPGRRNKLQVPTKLCRWAIHIKPPKYEPIEEQQSEAQNFDIEHPESWPAWTEQQESSSSFLTSIQSSLGSGNFTEAQQDDLPLSASLVSQALQADGSIGTADAWKFAIMSGNTSTIESLTKSLTRDDNKTTNIDAIYPFHTAAAYLDGGNVCCNMVLTLLDNLDMDYPFFHNVDNVGHTILDILMTSILRSHSLVSTGHVSQGFRGHNRFPGEEKDICGRWDADSPAIRELFSHGHSRIPAHWKHPFCHSAAQAVCHSLICLFGSRASPDINAVSGLFVRRCVFCGRELKLSPAHVLAVVAFHLAQNGRPEETLFGLLAVLVCLVKLGMDVSLTNEVSVLDILGLADAERCCHSPETPFSMMQKLSERYVEEWSTDCQTGWSCIYQVYLLAEQETTEAPEWDDMSGSSFYDGYIKEVHNSLHELSRIQCGMPRIGKIWACVQTELLTYRKIKEEDSWISERFSMLSLDSWLKGRTEDLRIELVVKDMIRPHKECGWFCNALEPAVPLAEDVCTSYFMNMDIFTRASYLDLEAEILGVLW